MTDNIVSGHIRCWGFHINFPSPGDLPYPGIKPRSPALWADALSSKPPGKPGMSEKEKQLARQNCYSETMEFARAFILASLLSGDTTSTE